MREHFVCTSLNCREQAILSRGPGDPPGSDSGGDVEDLWLHISLHYDKPWRPTYLLLERRSRCTDDDDCIPLAAAGHRLDNPAPALTWRTLWEVAAAVNLDAAMTLGWFRLVASPRRAVTSIRPWRLRMASLGMDAIEFWKGTEYELAARQAKQRRGRGRGGRGRGGRGALRPIGALAAPGPESLSMLPEAPVGEVLEADDLDLQAALGDGDEESPSPGDDDALFDDDWDESANPFGMPADLVMVDDVTDECALEASASEGTHSNTSSTDSSSSGSTSSSSDDSAAEGKTTELHINIPGSHLKGVIRRIELGGRREMYATCPNKAEHACCIKTRTVNPGGRPGQGRPLGFLTAWLQASCTVHSKAEHRDYMPSLEQRAAARLALIGMAAANRYLAFEHDEHLGWDREPAVFL